MVFFLDGKAFLFCVFPVNSKTNLQQFFKFLLCATTVKLYSTYGSIQITFCADYTCKAVQFGPVVPVGWIYNMLKQVASTQYSQLFLLQSCNILGSFYHKHRKLRCKHYCRKKQQICLRCYQRCKAIFLITYEKNTDGNSFLAECCTIQLNVPNDPNKW